MSSIRAELRFLRALLSLNLASVMEYRASFITAVTGMFVNNIIMLIFWAIFFDRFDAVRGYEIDDVILLYGIVAFAVGLAKSLAGNSGPMLASLIAQGRLDYYLALPRNLLSHAILSRFGMYAAGDFFFGLLILIYVGWGSPRSIVLLMITSTLSALIIVAFSIIGGSLAFYFGNAQFLSQRMEFSLITFSLYPNSLFTGGVRVLLFTLIPAGFVGAMPLEIVREHDFGRVGTLLLATIVIWTLALLLFHHGLRRYESGSALNVNL